MALPPIPTVTNIPPPPIRGTDTGLVFSNKTAAMLDTLHLDTIPEWNTSIDAVNALLPTIEDAADASVDAEAARDVAQGYASTATTQAGIATTQAGISTTQAGISTTQAGLSDAARVAAEAARDAAIGAGPLPAQSGNGGKFLTTDGTNASWDHVRWTQLASTTTGSVGQWDFTSIPQTYADLIFRVSLTPSVGGNSLQIALDHGSGFGTASTINTIGTGAHKGAIFIPNYTKDGGIILGGIRNNTSAGITTSPSANSIYSASAGIVGIRLSLSTGTGSSVSIQLFRR